MVRILLSGCNGKMGQVITNLARDREDVRIVAGYDIHDNIKNDYPVFTQLENFNIPVDVIIDFSHPSALQTVLNFALAKKIPLIVATTGLSDEQAAKLKEASKVIPVLHSANMSLGVNLLIDLVQKAAKVLYSNFDIEIIERHHNQKIDAPSGTALALADAINQAVPEKYRYVYDRHSNRVKRSKDEIGIHSVRGGTIAGDHTVIFAGNDEIIELRHVANSRDIFGVGALKAAVFIHDKNPGFYTMKDLLNI
ncbi:4-hydroxy-tetrahydrodipicolinate reductase [Thermoclostridium stercorarium subsp. thermolacticum DSM 2910]|jgi:4-hydroxy-tetrahydrodipicolinate reductase|uniref:4-hydroxy-tetrahydrodipicolinate reductase n=2 Tax=Thermoclostridium stercorarium TaxID=1510 RepID=A0A1B1YK13_THEST|nr:4-hydroxy-tetrahydrodipicolinate reductase [Thermoclostridium stercorarium]ANW98556.1 4-hydroxy-tetrahydrodipicolinate reductase [Thermoclostridium stercorarium subsp. thermolacticum DSM 2910]ANX01093.1 4-hydroxy-tetrahydrodipicolinate reductase [Thermoclostridium stercorarium subsp. leptospartum DSM 9219]